MKQYTKIICILDRSGSMDSIIGDAIGGFNSFLKGQKELDSAATLTIHLFDDEYLTICREMDIKKAEELTRKTYTPRGSTALYDAIGRSIDDEIELLSSTSLEERPEKTLCIILTDGLENSSTKYHRDRIKNMIEEMRNEFHWEFVFLAANQDASLSAESMGIASGNAYSFASTGDSVNTAYFNLNQATVMYRSAPVTADTTKLFASVDENKEKTEEESK